MSELERGGGERLLAQRIVPRLQRGCELAETNMTADARIETGETAIR